MNEPRLNLVELTVSELSMALKRTIEDAYEHVRVRGELGKVNYHSNGHCYFDLKDDRACIAGVIWRSTAQRLKLKLEIKLVDGETLQAMVAHMFRAPPEVIDAARQAIGQR